MAASGWRQGLSGFPVAVRALGQAGLATLRRQVLLPGGVPSGTLRALPGFWKEAALIAVPSLAFRSDGGLVSATFAALAGRGGAPTGGEGQSSRGPARP